MSRLRWKKKIDKNHKFVAQKKKVKFKKKGKERIKYEPTELAMINLIDW